MRSHGVMRIVDVDHTTSSSRRLSGADATPTATRVVGELPQLGRVPSGPLGGRTGTAGPADCDSTFMCHILAQRASLDCRLPCRAPCVLRRAGFT